MTIEQTITSMKSEVKWFRNAARKHALNASATAVMTTRIAETVEQEVHSRIADKLAEWVEHLEKAQSS